MRKFKCRPFNDVEVDLDDPKTYSYLPQNVKELDDFMFKEIGQALVYMKHFHPEFFPKNNSQRIRIEKLIKDFADNRKNNYENVLWYQEQIFLFQDETENMC